MTRFSNRRSFVPIQAAMQRRRNATILTNRRTVSRLEEAAAPPEVLLQAVIEVGEPTKEGQLVEAVAIPWFEIIDLILKAPDTIHQIDWRRWEEIIAGAYQQQGFKVTLTPRSNDGGRDVIAELAGAGSIRFFDQVKAYKPGHLVTAEEVRAMLGVLSANPNVSKGIITTTSDFAPGIEKDDNLRAFMPYRLELKPKAALLDWLRGILAKSGPNVSEA